MPRGCLQFVIVVFPDHTRLLFLGSDLKTYPTELQLNKANSSDTEALFLDLNLSITNGIVSSKIYKKNRMILIS